MMIRRIIAISGLLMGFLVGCASEPVVNDGPVLVGEVTLPPNDTAAILPTRYLSPTMGITPEVISPLQQVTLDADFVLITPTLPPSKTPSETPTQSPTPTLTRTPTVTVTATATAFLFPTSVIIPITQQVAVPLPQVCDSTWFFIQPRPASCPLNPPVADQGVYQQFENGYMVWVRGQDAIYVMYNDNLLPRWQVFRDNFEEGMAEESSEFEQAPPNRWQPRRGFGMLWRANSAVRARIGWATQELEIPYSVQVQTGDDGSIFISDPYSALFSLLPSGSNWQLFARQ